MSEWLLLLVLGLASYRGTRLITKDDFPPIQWVRDRIVDKAPHWAGELVQCPWCASGWVSLASVLIADVAGQSIPLPFVYWGAVWALASWLAHVEKDAMMISARVTLDQHNDAKPKITDPPLRPITQEELTRPERPWYGEKGQA